MSRSHRLGAWSSAVLLTVALAAVVAHKRPQSALPAVPEREETNGLRPLFISEEDA